MGKLEKLTKEQEKLMIQVRDEWLDRIFDCNTNLDKDGAEKGIEWLYELSGLKKPLIIQVESPMGCQYAAHLMKNMPKKMDSVSNSVWDSVVASTGDSVSNSVWDSIRRSVSNSVGDSVINSVGDSVGDSVNTSVGAPVINSVRDSVRHSVINSVIDFQDFCYYGSIRDYGWVAFYDFFNRIGIFKNEGFEKFNLLLKSGIYDMIQLDGVCIYCKLPNNITRNNQEQMHNINGYSIEWGDGYGQHYVNGRFLKPETFNKVLKKEYTIEEFFKEDNEDIKSAIIGLIQEKYGDEYLFHFFSKNLHEVDTYTNKKEDKYLINTIGMNVGVYSLFKGNINNVDVAYVRCYCPSTDRMFFLGVENHHDNAKDAIASLYRVPKKLKNHIKYIQRQGERFSTVFDDLGTTILKKITKRDVSDTLALTGEEYFNKITYEY